jgi:hippurate hydrolase
MDEWTDQNIAEILAPIDDALLARLISVRRWFHKNPELSFEEANTAERIIAELKRLGVDYDYQGVGHAVLGHVPGADSSRRTIALRAEMDALPGDETTGADYASTIPGKMHACGHGAHMAILLGAAELLKQQTPPGPVRLIFQPAEERGGGARVAISDGAVDGVAALFAGHVTHEFLTGKIMVRDGLVTSQSDSFRINVRGKGGHGARPHEAIDAIVISGFLITALQTIVSREVNPLHPSVVTIGKVRAGSAPNVIAEEAELHGSIRTSRAEVRQHIHHGIRRMVSAVAELHNAAIDIEIREGYPPVVNEPATAAIARDAATEVVGHSGVVAAEFPSMGSEDFSYYLDEVPGCFVRFGARHPDWEPVPLHSPAFDVDERVIGVGARFFDRVARAAHERIDELPDGV